MYCPLYRRGSHQGSGIISKPLPYALISYLGHGYWANPLKNPDIITDMYPQTISTFTHSPRFVFYRDILFHKHSQREFTLFSFCKFSIISSKNITKKFHHTLKPIPSPHMSPIPIIRDY